MTFSIHHIGLLKIHGVAIGGKMVISEL